MRDVKRIKKELKVNNDSAGKRLDQFIASDSDAGMSRSFAQRLIEEGGVSLNGILCVSKKLKIEAGDICTIEYEEPEDKLYGEDVKLDIVYEDDHILIVNKPRGMIVHPTPEVRSGTLVNALLNHVGDGLREVGDPERPGIVHRIDRDTSGLLAVAKTQTGYEGLRAQFDIHNIHREYEALVYNAFREGSGTVDMPIGRDPANRMRRKVNGLESKRAVTYYTVGEKIGNFSLIEVRLNTGRTHQIRVHMAYEGHPVAGDTVYGPNPDRYKFGGQILHARMLGFEHPVTGTHMMFEAKRPEYFVRAINKVRRFVK